MKITKKLTIDDVRLLKLHEVCIVEELSSSQRDSAYSAISRYKKNCKLDGVDVDYVTEADAAARIMTIVRTK